MGKVVLHFNCNAFKIYLTPGLLEYGDISENNHI